MRQDLVSRLIINSGAQDWNSVGGSFSFDWIRAERWMWSYLAGGHVADGTVGLDGFQLVQAPVEFLQCFHCQSGVRFICNTKRDPISYHLKMKFKCIWKPFSSAVHLDNIHRPDYDWDMQICPRVSVCVSAYVCQCVSVCICVCVSVSVCVCYCQGLNLESRRDAGVGMHLNFKTPPATRSSIPIEICK